MRVPSRPHLFASTLLLASLMVASGGRPAATTPIAAAPQAATAVGSGVRLRAVGSGAAPGRSAAVVVEAGALVHSATLYPLDAQGRLRGGGDALAQAGLGLDGLEATLRAAGTGLDRLVRLHVYVADAASTAGIERLLAERLAGPVPPAVTIVESRMPQAGVLVAVDGIAATPRRPPGALPERLVVAGLAAVAGGGAHVAVQPDGPFVIVSGRAAPGEFEAAVRGTVEQLRGDLQGVGLGLDHVVQVKAFLGDMSRTERLGQIVASAFQGTPPPLVVTEWRESPLPVEIELVATAPGAAAGGERLAFVEPIASRYSRVARVFAGRPIFLSGLTGSAADPATQVQEVFDQVQRLVTAAGSDMRHIAKATYYVADKRADEAINTIRPSVYDPARPPAASKISVQGTGYPGKATVIDMIAVTTSR